MKKVSFVTNSEDCGNNEIFRTPHGSTEGTWARFHRVFRESGYDVCTWDIIPAEEADLLIFCRVPPTWALFRLLLKRKLHKALYHQFEPPVVVPLHYHRHMRWFRRLFGAVVTWDDDLAGSGGNYRKGYYPMYPLSTEPPRPAFARRKLLTNISGNKESGGRYELYSKRAEAIRFMEQNHPADFDLYGTGWTAEEYPSFRGTIPDKLEVLRRYKFSFCFENMCAYKGYVTEKIFDCLHVNTVPIYWGAENITDYVPAECFIDFREFGGYGELYKFITDMDEAAWLRYAEAKNRYAGSARYAPFLPQAFADNVLGAVKRLDAGVRFSYAAAWLSLARLVLWRGLRWARGVCGYVLGRLRRPAGR